MLQYILCGNFGSKILDTALSDKSTEEQIDHIISILQEANKILKENTVPLSMLEISKRLSKDPSNYSKEEFEHVTVAQRLSKKNVLIRKGDLVSYIICKVCKIVIF